MLPENLKSGGMKLIKLFFLGDPKILLGNINITQDISSKGVGIFSYIIGNRSSGKIPRERIASLFWNDSSRESAKYNLRYTLWSIKKVFKDNGLEDEIIISPDKEHCCINDRVKVWSDIGVLEEIAEEVEGGNTSRAEECMKIYKGEFLQNISIKGAPELDDWIIYEKERFQRLYFNTLSKLSEMFSSQGQYKKSIECLQKLLYINQLDEDIHRQLMEAYYLDGDRVSAIKQFKKCSLILRNELNIGPMESTLNLYDNIKNGECHSNQDISSREQLKSPEYLVLSEILEKIIDTIPDVLKGIEDVYILELTKLIPELKPNKDTSNITYLSNDIEKLRIFKAAARLINEASKYKMPVIELFDEVDYTTQQFLNYISQRYPHVKLDFLKR